jgi:peptide deformylase
MGGGLAYEIDRSQLVEKSDFAVADGRKKSLLVPGKSIADREEYEMTPNIAQDSKARPDDAPMAADGRRVRRASEEMAALGIVQLGDPVLSSGTVPINVADERDEVARIVERLSATADQVQLRHTFTTGAMGIAAPQIGEGRSVALFRPNDDDQVVLINPRVVRCEPVEEAAWVEDTEGCLSFFDFRCWVRRPRAIVVAHVSLTGEQLVSTFDKGRQARDVLHEIDHLNGVLCFDSLGSGARNIARA